MGTRNKKDIIKTLKKVRDLKLQQVAEINNLIFNFENNKLFTVKEIRGLTEKLLKGLGYAEVKQ